MTTPGSVELSIIGGWDIFCFDFLRARGTTAGCGERIGQKKSKGNHGGQEYEEERGNKCH